MLSTQTLGKWIAVQLCIALAAFVWACAFELPEQEAVAGSPARLRARREQLADQHSALDARVRADRPEQQARRGR